MTTHSERSGVGGWLSLFIFWLTIFRPFMLIVSLANLLDRSQSIYNFFLYSGLISIAVGYLIAIFLANKYRWAPLVTQIYLVTLVAWNFISPLILGLGDTKDRFPQAISAGVASAIFIFPWIIYFSVSKRVKVTYLLGQSEIPHDPAYEAQDIVTDKDQTKNGASKPDGRTLHRAVVINSSDHEQGIRSEYRYLETVEGELGLDWTLNVQRLFSNGGRTYDELTIQRRTGGSATYYFDITSFHNLGQAKNTEPNEQISVEQSDLFDEWMAIACQRQPNGLLDEEVEHIWKLARNEKTIEFEEYVEIIARRPPLSSPWP